MSFTLQGPCLLGFRTIRHQCTPADTDGHQRTPDGQSAVTNFTLAELSGILGHGRAERSAQQLTCQFCSVGAYLCLSLASAGESGPGCLPDGRGAGFCAVRAEVR